MTTAQTIAQRVVSLPEETQREVLDFVDFLRARNTERGDDMKWSTLSLVSAMRGMEVEESPYTLDDIKEPVG